VVAQLLCGSGLRLIQVLRLCIKDLVLEQRSLTVSGGKGDKDPATELLPLGEAPETALQGVRGAHQADLAAGWDPVELPLTLEKKYRIAAREWGRE
jgi:hypothetical protein